MGCDDGYLGTCKAKAAGQNYHKHHNNNNDDEEPSGSGNNSDDKCTRNGGCDANGDGVPDVPDPYTPPVPLGTNSDPKCLPGDLVECFYRRGRLPTGNWNISQDELNSLMLAVYYDIAKRPVSLSDFNDRAIYDTPFWDGFGADKGSACIRNSCYARTDVNYFAQGMYSAKYEGQVGGLTLMNVWKLQQYHHLASSGSMDWFNTGFSFYESVSPVPSP